jgi:hypothetical protein
MCEKCANNDTDSPIIMIQPWRGGAVYLSIQLGHQCHGNMNHGFRHWYKPLMWHWMGPQPPSPGRSPQRFYMYSCKANSYRRPKYMQPEETTDKYSNHQLVVFRVDDSDAIQGHDSGHDSEGVKREKTVNR